MNIRKWMDEEIPCTIIRNFEYPKGLYVSGVFSDAALT
jgi:hypothetical protein